MAQQPREYSRNAALQYQMWQQQGQMFAQSQPPPVDVALPRMHRQTMPDLGPLPSPGGPCCRPLCLNTVNHYFRAVRPCKTAAMTGMYAWRGLSHAVLMLAGPMDKEMAQKAVQQAREYAMHVVHRAAKYAAAGGIAYQAPPGFELQTVFPTVGALRTPHSGISHVICRRCVAFACPNLRCADSAYLANRGTPESWR